ncbi:MAG: hypothetical protein D6730_22060 [Bacteroidetes bacterium]|nr:MAG: hypothetical protein D6730_22060 [Bacteroidota bacterium]
MKLIYDIVKKLTKQELRMVRQQIRNSAFEYEKMGKLFDLVTRYDERDEEFYAQKLYGKPPDNTFRVTKSRLKRMLENALLNDKSLSAYDAAYINAKLQTQKKLMQGEILLGRGAYMASKNLLLQVIATAKKYHLYDEWFQAELLLYRRDGIRSTVKEFEKRTEALLHQNQQTNLIHEGLILHYSISNVLQNRSFSPDKFEELHAKIDRIREIAENTDHPQLWHTYYLTENYYYQATGDYERALSFCHQYFELLHKEKALYSKQKEANVYVQMAGISMMLNQLDEASSYAEKALAMYSPEEMNYLVSLQLAFRIAFYRKHFEEALAYVEQALQHPQFETSKTLAAKWHYYHACLLFRQGQFQEAYRKLDDTTPLLADKQGMNLHIRMLEIMIIYELGHYDLIETKILNMRQFVKRTQKQQTSARNNGLIQLLSAWHKSNYDFVHIYQMLQDAGQATNPDADMGVHSQEFIRLEDWIASKVQASTP